MLTLCFVVVAAGQGVGAAPPVRPEERALAYLAAEVPRWRRENGCYSCHNNGDAARALFAAVRRGRTIPAAALADTTSWLQRPEGWDRNGGEGKFNDRKLARLQFAATLAEAQAAGRVPHRVLAQAAAGVAALQSADGSWQVVPEGTLGTPATHGTALATALARTTLQRAGAERYREAIARADAWLRKAPVETVLDAAAVLLGLGTAKDAPARAQRRRCRKCIGKGEARGGGWGPRAGSASEVFDSAVVLLALAVQEPSEDVAGWKKRGRAYLLAAQERDGGWPETTRPPGSDSYAQRVSTTGWATMALLATR
jgi:hypothetical protein